jgi:hypothetical protein
LSKNGTNGSLKTGSDGIFGSREIDFFQIGPLRKEVREEKNVFSSLTEVEA